MFGYKHKRFTILFWCLLLHRLTFFLLVSLLFLFFLFHIPLVPYLNCISLIILFILVFDYAFVDSNPFEFLHKCSFALCKMVTFHATKHSNLTIVVDKSWMTVVFEHCFCAMFTFHPSSLHISKDVSYDSNNFVLSSLYQIPMTSSQGRQWVVGYGHYCIVGDSLVHNSQVTILTARTIGFVIKTMK